MKERDISTPADRNRIAGVLEKVARKIRSGVTLTAQDNTKVREALDELARLECPEKPFIGGHRPFFD